MSIINDALKKADYLRKWKSFVGSGLQNDPAGVTQTVVESAVQTLPDEKAPSPKAMPQPAKPVYPPFKIYFDEANQRAGRTSVFSFSVQKIVITGIIAFLACGFFVLIFGPWFYLWTGEKSRPEKTVVVEREVANSTSSGGSETHAAPIQVSPVASVNDQSLSSVKKASFRPYQNPNGTRVSVKPAPKSLTEPKLESRYLLTGVSVLSATERAAIINGKVVEVGNRIGEAEIVAIDERRVTLKKHDKEFVLMLE